MENTQAHFCMNCGRPLPANAKFCTHCGQRIAAPTTEIKQQVVQQPQKKEENIQNSTEQASESSTSIKKTICIALLLSIFLVVLVYTLGRSSSSSSYSSTTSEEQARADSMRAAYERDLELLKTVEGTREYLQHHPFWHYTKKPAKNWLRIEFKGNKAYHQLVSPGKGAWGKPYISNYTVSEKRYSNTGERYICVEFSYFNFIPAEKRIVTLMDDITVEEGDSNPWD